MATCKRSWWGLLLESQSPRWRWARMVTCGVLLGVSVFWLIVLGASFGPEHLYLKDVLQDYLAARAIGDGLSPYLPLPHLAARYVPEWSGPVLPHPTPHPPTALLLTLPLVLGPYRLAAWLWLSVEVALLLVWVWLVVRWWKAERPVRVGEVGLLMGLLVAIAPLAQDLVYGQWMVPLLLVVTLAWMDGRHGRPWRSGLWLGLAMGIKPIFWPLLLIWGVRRLFKALGAALVSCGSLWGAALLVVGPAGVVDYFRAGVLVAPYYRAFAFNFSLLTLGYRLFEGTGSALILSVTAPPLMNVPALAPVVSFVLTGVILVGSFWYQSRLDEEGAFGVGWLGSLLLSPVVWRHYFVLALWPLALGVKRLRVQGWPEVKTWLWMVITALLVMPDYVWEVLLTGGDKAQAVPFWSVMGVWLVTVAGLGGAFWLAWRGEVADGPFSGTEKN